MGVPCVGVQRLHQFALWELQKAFQGNTSELHHLEEKVRQLKCCGKRIFQKGKIYAKAERHERG